VERLKPNLMNVKTAKILYDQSSLTMEAVMAKHKLAGVIGSHEIAWSHQQTSTGSARIFRVAG
jgi:hypothetical protein